MDTWEAPAGCSYQQQHQTQYFQDCFYERKIAVDSELPAVSLVRASVRGHPRQGASVATYQHLMAQDTFQMAGMADGAGDNSFATNQRFTEGVAVLDETAPCGPSKIHVFGSQGNLSGGSRQQQQQQYDACWTDSIPAAAPPSPEEVAAMMEEEHDIIHMNLLTSSAADSSSTRATVGGQLSPVGSGVLEQLQPHISAAAAAASASLMLHHTSSGISNTAAAGPPSAHMFSLQHFQFEGHPCTMPDMGGAEAAAAALAACTASQSRGVKRCSADGVTTSHSSLTAAPGAHACVSDTAAAAAAAYNLAPGACSPGSVSCIPDAEDAFAGAVPTTAAAAKARKAKKTSVAAAAAAAAQEKQHAGTAGASRRVRQRRYNEVVALREELATVTSKQSSMETKLDTLRTDNSSLLTRLADVTSKWQSTVADNARLTKENSEAKAMIAELQQRLLAAEKQQQQQTELLAQVSLHHVL